MGNHSVKNSSGDGEYWESKIFGAFTLIVVGVIFLMNTTGVLAWSFWINFFSYWPLFLVSVGLSIILSGTRLLKFIGSLVTFLLFIFIVYLAANNLVPSSRIFPSIQNNGELKSDEFIVIQEKYEDVELREVIGEIPFGNTKINTSSSNDYLVLNSTYYQDESKIYPSEKFENGILSLILNTNRGDNFIGIPHSPSYEIGIGNRNLKTSFNLKFGSGNSEFSFTKQNIENLNAEIGAGNLRFDFDLESVPTGEFNLKNGLGNIELNIPEEVGVKIVYKVGLGNVQLNGESISAGSNSSVFESEDFDQITKKVTINVEIGLGNLDINI